METRTRSFSITINNFDVQDLKELDILGAETTYYAVGYEGIDPRSSVHPHLHAALHFKNARTFGSLLGRFTRKPHCESVKDWPAYILYLQGYHINSETSEYELKEPVIGPNLFHSQGSPPSKEKNISPMDSMLHDIISGESIKLVKKKYPKLWFYHRAKIIDAYKDRIEQEPKIWIYDELNYDDEIHEIIGESGVVHVTDLDMLDIYNSYDIVVYKPCAHSIHPTQWVMNSTPSYKVGYRYVPIYCKHIILMLNKENFNQFQLSEFPVLTIESYAKDLQEEKDKTEGSTLIEKDENGNS
nr:MAG: replication associated protein [Cressdnaviricota sp.]